jgi:hypothetical protein
VLTDRHELIILHPFYLFLVKHAQQMNGSSLRLIPNTLHTWELSELHSIGRHLEYRPGLIFLSLLVGFVTSFFLYGEQLLASYPTPKM